MVKMYSPINPKNKVVKENIKNCKIIIGAIPIGIEFQNISFSKNKVIAMKMENTVKTMPIKTINLRGVLEKLVNPIMLISYKENKLLLLKPARLFA
jgi:hypothetical protein